MEEMLCESSRMGWEELSSRDPRSGPRLPRERVLDREAEGGWALAEAVAASPPWTEKPSRASLSE